MKYLSSWKGMKKSTKVGLVTSAVYMASAFALPAFASQVTEKPVVQPVNISQITTLEQADNLYKAKLVEYAEDKKITVDEITQLVDLKKKGYSIVLEQFRPLKEEKSGLMEKVNELDKNITSYEKRLTSLDNRLQHPNIKESLEENLKQFEKEILVYYPGLINKGDRGIIYSAETELKPYLVHIFDKIIKNTHELLNNNYNDGCLSVFLNTSATLGDVTAFYEILKNKITVVKKEGKPESNTPALMSEKQDLTTRLNNLKNERHLIVDSERMKQLKDKVEQGDKELWQIDGSFALLRKYSNTYDHIKSFKENNPKDFGRYFSISFFLDIIGGSYESSPYESMRGYLADNKELAPQLESYFKAEGFDVKVVDKLRNPAKTRWPLWLGIPLALFGPMLRNPLLIKYLGGGKQTGDDYGVSMMWGLMEGMLFFMLLDGLHPLVFPARMIGTPILWHGLLKATGGDKALYDYAK